jgi:hypothetical protein
MRGDVDHLGVIELNVGGQLFSTTEATLLAVHDEGDESDFFKSLVGNIKSGDLLVAKDKNDVIFIDRSPRYFEYILNYLRDGYLQDNLSPKILSGIKKEAEFYCMTNLARLTTVLPITEPQYEFFLIEEFAANVQPNKGRFFSKSLLVNDLVDTEGLTVNSMQRKLIDNGFIIENVAVIIDAAKHKNPMVRSYTVKKRYK